MAKEVMMTSRTIAALVAAEKFGPATTSAIRRKDPSLDGRLSVHLNTFLKQGYVSRKDNVYSITNKGKEKIKAQLAMAPIDSPERPATRSYGKNVPDAQPQAVVPKLNTSATADELVGNIANVLQENAMLRDALENIRTTINSLLGDDHGTESASD